MEGLEHKYDIIHQDKNYEEEAGLLLNLIGQHVPHERVSLLDVACGTGNHLQWLTKRHDCYGLDLNEKLVDLARQKGLDVVCGDMKAFDLGREFDVITCLFGSIAHVENYQELSDTMLCFRKHLKKGGVVFLEPWLFLNQYWPRKRSRKISDDVMVTSANSLEGNVAVLEKTYYIGEEEFKTTLRVVCFTQEEYFSAAASAGFKMERLDMKLDSDFPNGLYLLSDDKALPSILLV